MSRQTLGIMATSTIGEPPFGSRSFYRKLCLAGKQAGLDVFVFAPEGIDWMNATVDGYTFEGQNAKTERSSGDRNSLDYPECEGLLGRSELEKRTWGEQRQHDSQMHRGSERSQGKQIMHVRSERWVRRCCAFPNAVYDRCFFTNRLQAAAYQTAVRRLQEEFHVLFLGCGLKGKLSVQRMLEKDGRFSSYLPRTELMRSVSSLASWLQARGQVLLKPQAGSQGRGVLLVQHSASAAPSAGVGTAAGEAAAPRTAPAPRARARREAPPAAHAQRHAAAAAFTVRGRDAHNRRIARGFADEAALLLWLRRFTGRRRYLLQQYLLLQAHSGDAYDVRALVQKNSTGRWGVTGMAVRLGQDGSLTSNLHGGGTVEPVGDFLANQFGTDRAAVILNELQKLSKLIPEALEAHHGRLVELGIDYGIDTKGHIWILEVNSKPGRSIFDYFHDDKIRSRAITNPIYYARYLLKQSIPLIKGIHIGG